MLVDYSVGTVSPAQPTRTGRRRSVASFAVSACFHGSILGWVALGPSLSAPEKAKSLYEQEIQPGEKKIIWYSLREKLPEVSPTEVTADARPPRARVKFDQTIVSGAKDDERSPQKIYLPEPPPEEAKPAPLPNVVAVAPVPKAVRSFVAPVDRPRPETPAPVLPDAPKTATVEEAKLPIAAPAVRPQPRAFQAPETKRVDAAAVSLPDAPRVVANAELQNLPLPSAGPKPQPLAFAAPPETRLQRQAALLLPDAPAVASATEIKGGLPIAAPMPKPQRGFTAPASSAAGRAGYANGGPGTGGSPAAIEEAPAAPMPAGVNGTSVTTMAIVGLNPANTTTVPAPPGPRDAGFSAGPVVRPEGGSGSGSPDSRISVPGLLVGGGAKDNQPTIKADFSPTSRENLLAAARMLQGAMPSAAAAPKTLAGERAAPVGGAPGGRLNGRLVYTIAIQMPNVTSYSGSWIVWFALREPGAAGPLPDVRPPVPLRKVDPKYVQSAVADKVEGKVLLSATIRADGNVEGAAVISGLDPRLDASSVEALSKWMFEPALRNGQPVMVDAVFEIPFHLAPKLPAK